MASSACLETAKRYLAAIEQGAAGGEMRAYFAVFFEFRDGKIVAQRNYDCFDPW
jgi:ketosteroid isomerase-like protein